MTGFDGISNPAEELVAAERLTAPAGQRKTDGVAEALRSHRAADGAAARLAAERVFETVSRRLRP